MTQQEMIETIIKHFPNENEKRIRTMLNDANNKFIVETQIIQDKVEQLYVAGQKYYAKSSFTRTGGGELLLAKSLRIIDLDNKNLVWWVENNRLIGIGLKQSNGKVEALTTEGHTIEVQGVFSDPGFSSTLSEEPDYDSAFHYALVSKVLYQLNSERGNMNVAGWHKNEYIEQRIEAKRFVGRGGVKGDYKTHESSSESNRVPF